MNVETANRLYELRKRFGYSQEELAEKIGVSRQAISKWERSEASPDTDNLIMLSRVYGITIDELINGPSEGSDESPKDEKADDKNTQDGNNEKKNTHIHFDKGIHIDDGKEHVHIDFSGIHVESEDSKVHIDKNGVFVSDDGEIKIDTAKTRKKHPVISAFRHFPYPILTVIAYLIFGFLDICGGWAAGWVVFLTVPLYYSLLEAIEKKRPSKFAYAVLVTGIYVYLGIMYGLWHPYWIMFISVPIYDGLCKVFFPKVKGEGHKILFKIGDDDEDDEDEDLEEMED